MCMRYVSIQQTIRYSICKISDIACGHTFWTVLVSWSPRHEFHGVHSCHYILHKWRPVSLVLWNHITRGQQVSSMSANTESLSHTLILLHVLIRAKVLLKPTISCLNKSVNLRVALVNKDRFILNLNCDVHNSNARNINKLHRSHINHNYAKNIL